MSTQRVEQRARRDAPPAAAVAEGVSFAYGPTPALRQVDLTLAAGESVALLGPSGSGKSTLLHCLAGILVPDSGRVLVGEEDLTAHTEAGRSRLRLRTMGVIFQLGDLISELTLVENVMLPLELLGRGRAAARSAALDVLDLLDVAAVADRRVGEVSGGQAQRAAVARALAHQPGLVLADEPTGSLDTVNAEGVMSALTAACRDRGTALLVVTHDHRVAAHLDRHVTLRDGRLVRDESPAA